MTFGKQIKKPQELAKLLNDLEVCMCTSGLWSDIQPSAEAMASQQPFACDQMSFPEWLQYIFIPRLTAMVEAQSELPSSSEITPMAEYFFSQKGIDANELIDIIRTIDALLTVDQCNF